MHQLRQWDKAHTRVTVVVLSALVTKCNFPVHCAMYLRGHYPNSMYNTVLLEWFDLISVNIKFDNKKKSYLFEPQNSETNQHFCLSKGQKPATIISFFHFKWKSSINIHIKYYNIKIQIRVKGNSSLIIYSLLIY